MALFSVRDLSFAYPDADRRALENVSVDIERGEYLCVCGKSGCGKTTLLRQLKSVLSPHGKRSGTVLLDGIVLDEATAMLDPIGRSEVISTIERLNRDEGITVVLITHHMNEAEHADRVIVMNEGRVAMDGAPREVFAQVEKLKSIGLTVPDTVELLYELRGAGCDLPLTAITVDECADAIARCFGKSAKEDN